jgi:hypothetical protein
MSLAEFEWPLSEMANDGFGSEAGVRARYVRGSGGVINLIPTRPVDPRLSLAA